MMTDSTEGNRKNKSNFPLFWTINSRVRKSNNLIQWMHSWKDLKFTKLKVVSEKNEQTKHFKCYTKASYIIKLTITIHVILLKTIWGTKFTYKIHASQNKTMTSSFSLLFISN